MRRPRRAEAGGLSGFPVTAWPRAADALLCGWPPGAAGTGRDWLRALARDWNDRPALAFAPAVASDLPGLLAAGVFDMGLLRGAVPDGLVPLWQAGGDDPVHLAILPAVLESLPGPARLALEAALRTPPV